VVDRRSDLDLALMMADRADQITMVAFLGGSLISETKPDGTTVTETDREVERELRGLVAAARPGDGFLGEESDLTEGGSARRWIVDPIDGTGSFVAGGKTWGTLIALEEQGCLTLGVASGPAVEGRWWGADGIGAFGRTAVDGAPRGLAVSVSSTLDRATWSSNPSLEALSGPSRALTGRLCVCGSYVGPREWTTHPMLMVAEGTLDLCVQFGGAAWDYAAPAAIVCAAGGSFSYLDGCTELVGLFTNGRLHDPVLELLGDGDPGR
jgi:histidinol-phosphatase